jgi:adenine-specific DNA methylase
VKEDVAEEILQYYKTPCPNGDHDADVMYYFWVKELDCVSCGHTVPLFKDYRVAKGRYENGDKYNVLCPDCGEVTLVDDWQSESVCNNCGHGFVPKEGNVSRGKYNCPDCGQKYAITDAIQEQGGYDLRLYGVEYYCEQCNQKLV